MLVLDDIFDPIPSAGDSVLTWAAHESGTGSLLSKANVGGVPKLSLATSYCSSASGAIDSVLKLTID